MSDVIDDANDHAEHLMQLALADHQRRTAGPTTSAEWCADCGEDIPEPRRVAVLGCQLCIDCQSVREARR